MPAPGGAGVAKPASRRRERNQDEDEDGVWWCAREGRIWTRAGCRSSVALTLLPVWRRRQGPMRPRRSLLRVVTGISGVMGEEVWCKCK